jgi:glutaredoxin
LNQDFGPDTPEEAVWKQAKKTKLQRYMALRPDAFCEWSVKNHMEELSQEDTAEMMRYWYEKAVDEQKKELREYKKKAKLQEVHSQLPQIELTAIEEGGDDLSQGLGDRSEPIKA